MDEDSLSSEPDEAGQTSGRPRELEDFLNYRVYHPLSIRLARLLANGPVTPNMVSVMGAVTIMLAAWAYVVLPTWPGVFLGLLLHVSWHVFDGADGDLARINGRTSSLGETVDGVCDYAGHIVLYVALGAMLAGQIHGWAWFWMCASGISRIAQATHYEAQRRQYQYWIQGTPWLRSESREGGLARGPLGWIGSTYVRFGGWLAPGSSEVERLFTNASEQARISLMRHIRREMASVLKGMTLLSANYRTLALGVAMMIGSPLYFFVFEAVLLTLLLLVSLRRSRQASLRIVALSAASKLR